jgi:transcriptional repressor NrdR
MTPNARTDARGGLCGEAAGADVVLKPRPNLAMMRGTSIELAGKLPKAGRPRRSNRMRCPKCGNLEDKVIDSRSAGSGVAIRRRRVCLGCGYRFTTYEEIVKAKLRVVKRDGRREELSRPKMINGIERACEKRAIGQEQIERLVEEVIESLEAEFEREVPSEEIGNKVMERLERLDEVAFVRFASVYRRFRDVNQFLSAIRGMIARE